jgi:sterol 3beta-glucosyltransferase
MRVAILTAGSLGDVQPYVALGAGLRDAGFSVRLATHVGFRELAEAHGLEFAAVTHPVSALTADPRWEALQHAGDTAARFVGRTVRLSRMLQPLLVKMLDDHWAACQGADAVLSSVSAFAGPQQAAALGVPHCWALVQPMSPTAAYPHFMAPNALRLPGRLNFETHVLAERVHHRLFGRAADRWAATTPGAAVRRPARGALFGSGAGPVLYGISHALLPAPADWPPNITQSGHWFLDAPADAPLPAQLSAFLDAGPPPVFVHAARIGSRRSDFRSTVQDVLRRLGLRAVLSGGQPDAPPMTDSILDVPPVPFDRLFPRVAAVVHHGGAGTTATALRAGTPSLGVPGFFDQPFWSARVAALGAGPRPLPARRVTAERLESALAALVQSPSMRERAADVARRISSERGVDEAVAHLQAMLAAGHA